MGPIVSTAGGSGFRSFFTFVEKGKFFLRRKSRSEMRAVQSQFTYGLS